MNPVPVSLPFADRAEAGRRLAERVRAHAVDDPLVLALPRGGVPVGAELARALGADFDVLVVRKIGLPGHPETGVGAVSEDGRVLYDDLALARMHIPRQALSDTVASERDELDRRRRTYRGERPLPRIAGRDCVVVDDGAATGGTARAALRTVRQAGPARLILAVPVASPEAVELLRGEVDALVVLGAPDNFRSVGEWYREFDQLSDENVTSTLFEVERSRPRSEVARAVRVPAGRAYVDADLTMPEELRGVVVMAFDHGRVDPRGRAIASALRRAGYATLLVDPPDEEETSGEWPAAVVTWLRRATDAAGEPLGILCSGATAESLPLAAAALPEDVSAVVVHGGRIDRAGEALAGVRAPTLLLAESGDASAREAGERARALLGGPVESVVVSAPEGDGEAWREAAVRTLDWFDRHLTRDSG
ncbi:phosphoribosyltransferase family protein [Nocardiopsis alba]|uniref:phosphoribosyltransferase family protein n=1 Tax=Nocardiopsis alba TaxID=53437 RepID=UPI0033A34C95